jgi:branched-chain amino acid transport system substrate-binding protein
MSSLLSAIIKEDILTKFNARIVATIVALVLTFSFTTPRSAPAATSGDPVTVYAILSVTGNAAFFGGAEAQLLKVVADTVNAKGGINGHPVEFSVLDDQTNPQIAIQLVNEVIGKHVPLFIGPSVPASCLAAGPLIDKTGPISICLNPAARPAPGSFQFAPYYDSVQLATAWLRYFREHGITRIAMFDSTDSSGRDADQAFDVAFRLPENAGMTKVTEEHYSPTDVTVTATMVRIKAAKPQAIVSYNTGLPFGTVLHAMHDVGVDVPIATSGVNMTYEQMKQYSSFMPSQVLFGGTLGWAPGVVGPGPIRDAQNTYLAALHKAGLRPSASYSTAWDPALLAVEVLRAVGPSADPEKARAYLSALHGWVATQGVYDFKSFPQRGVGTNAALILRWDKTKQDFVPASGRGGTKLTP